MVFETIAEVARNLVPYALILALGIFASSAIRARTLRSLPAQLSIFVIIWVVAELLRVFLLMGIVSATPELQFLGLVIHAASMVAFGLFIVFRFFRHALRGR
jgi:hypothetical protein